MATTPDSNLPGRQTLREALTTTLRYASVVAGMWGSLLLLRWIQNH